MAHQRYPGGDDAAAEDRWGDDVQMDEAADGERGMNSSCLPISILPPRLPSEGARRGELPRHKSVDVAEVLRSGMVASRR